jgi:hypothetical protein
VELAEGDFLGLEEMEGLLLVGEVNFKTNRVALSGGLDGQSILEGWTALLSVFYLIFQ